MTKLETISLVFEVHAQIFKILTPAGAEAIIRCGDLRSEFTKLLTIARKKERADSLRAKKERERIRYICARTG